MNFAKCHAIRASTLPPIAMDERYKVTISNSMTNPIHEKIMLLMVTISNKKKKGTNYAMFLFYMHKFFLKYVQLIIIFWRILPV
jgi:hypothetical protein